jgi:hypothetical protein
MEGEVGWLRNLACFRHSPASLQSELLSLAHTQSQFDVSPDGLHIAFQTQQVLQENIGIIDNVQQLAPSNG